MKNKRKKYFVNKKFQTEFIVKFCFLLTLGAVISGGIIYLMSRSTLTTTFVNSRLVIKSTADFILPTVFLSGAVTVVLISLATIAIALFLTHRIVGPLYRLERVVDLVAAGDLTVCFHLRKKDEMKTLAANFKKMTEGLNESIGTMKSIAGRLKTEINSQKGKEDLEALEGILSRYLTDKNDA
jgi:methyl-accepting chemotaxis protein